MSTDILSGCAVRAAIQKEYKGPVTQEWTHELPFMQQMVLLLAMRGPDGLAKYEPPKMLLRWYRRCVVKGAFVGRALTNPIEPSGGSFDGPSLKDEREDGRLYDDALDPWTDRMMEHVFSYMKSLDAVPHHFQMHFMHGVEILGYKHPDPTIRMWWNQVYRRLVNDLHLHPETMEELDFRLGDSQEGWLRRAEPATIA